MDAFFALCQTLGAGPVHRNNWEAMAEKPPPPMRVVFPEPHFTRALVDKDGRRMPQAIGHRGYKAAYPENTMAAFRGAVDIGAHAIETDVHLSKDKVVVLSHDASLKRCYGIDHKIPDCSWSYLSTLRTTSKPAEPMPRLEDLLRYLAEPEQKDKWLLLDIKLDNDPSEIMKYMAQVVEAVSPGKGPAWSDRIVLGCWTAKYIPLAHKHFPGYPITNIGFSSSYSRQFFCMSNISFNMLYITLLSTGFLKAAKRRNRLVYAWTVNETKTMDWCIRHELDGVISDDPKKFLAVCKNFNDEKVPGWSFMLVFRLLRIALLVRIFGWLLAWKHGFSLSSEYVSEKIE